MEKIIAECKTIWTEEQNQHAIRIIQDGLSGKKLSGGDYHIIKKFEVVSMGGVYKIRNKQSGRYMVTKHEAPLIIANSHSESGHGGEKVTFKAIKDQYHNIPMPVVKEYISNCETCCEKKRRKETGPGMVFKPIAVKDFNDRAQIDLVNFQTCPDGNYKYVLHYIEYLTKYHILRPLTSKCAKEVAEELLNIFTDFGAPVVLQADNGGEFTADIIKELTTLWPSLKLVNGRPRHPQSQGCVERANAELKKKVQIWMKKHKSSNWSRGIRFVQWQMNTTHHQTINTKPYNALFGINPRCGLTKKFPDSFLQTNSSEIQEV